MKSAMRSPIIMVVTLVLARMQSGITEAFKDIFGSEGLLWQGAKRSQRVRGNSNVGKQPLAL